MADTMSVIVAVTAAIAVVVTVALAVAVSGPCYGCRAVLSDDSQIYGVTYSITRQL